MRLPIIGEETEMTEITEDWLETEVVDKCGIDYLLSALSTICYAKAEHLATNWQDSESAKIWERVAKHLDRAPKIQA